MSLFTSSCGMSDSSTAWAPNCAARVLARSSVRLATTMRFTPARAGGRATRVMVSPAPMSNRLAARQIAEDLLGQAHGGEGHRHRVFADGGVGTHLLGSAERGLEQAPQQRPDGAGLAGHGVGGFHLPQNLRFASTSESSRKPPASCDEQPHPLHAHRRSRAARRRSNGGIRPASAARHRQPGDPVLYTVRCDCRSRGSQPHGCRSVGKAAAGPLPAAPG